MEIGADNSLTCHADGALLNEVATRATMPPDLIVEPRPAGGSRK